MKKKFVRVMLFGALTLAVSTAVTSCKDYDDDIKNLQEQIDKVTSTSPVSTDDMKKAISSAIQTLQTQLQTAIDGKADSKAVQDLLKTVEALQTALDNKADASTIKTLGDQITALSTQVNAIEGTLAETKKDLEAKIADLTEKLAGVVPSEILEQLTADLADAKNELATVKEMADNNAAAIVKIQGEIVELKKLDSRIAALEDFNKNAATQDDLAGYVASSDLAGLVDSQVLDMLKDNGSIAKYVNDAIESQVLAETSAINAAIKGVDDQLAALNLAFEKYKEDQSTAYQTVTSNISTLSAFQATIEEALTTGGYADFAAVLTEITTIKGSYGYCATKADFDGKVETYLTSYKTEVDNRFTTLETRIGALENQIQSVVYIPEYEDGKIVFMSYFYQNELVAETKPIQMKFRISPATAAANFTENYTPSFDGQEIKSRAAAEIYKIENTEVDDATGIVTYTLSTSTEKSYAVSLNLIAKDQSKNLTNISSNYFPVISDYRNITTATLDSPNKGVNSILYDKPLSVVDYATGALIKITGTDRAGSAVTNEVLNSSVNTDKFTVTYELTGTNADGYTIDGGVLRLKVYDVSSNEFKVTPKAWIKFAGVQVYTNFAQVRAERSAVDATYTPDVPQIEFNGATDGKADISLAYGSTGLTTDIGIERSAYEALSQDNFTFTADRGVTLRFKAGATKNELEVVVPKGTIKGSYTPTAVVKVSDVQKFTVTPTITVKVTDDTYKLTHNTAIVNTKAIKLQPDYLPNREKPSSIEFNLDVTTLFSNYAAIKTAAEAVGASIKFSLETPITGVSLVGEKLTVTNAYSNKEGTALRVITKVMAGSVELGTNSTDVITTVNLADLSGTWVNPSATTVNIGKDKLSQTFALAAGASWADVRGKTMWSAGVESSQGTTEWGATPFSVYGFVAPTFTVSASDAQYVTINSKGDLTLTGTGQSLVHSTTITVTINVNSQWGTISAPVSSITVTIDTTQPTDAM